MCKSVGAFGALEALETWDWKSVGFEVCKIGRVKDWKGVGV